MDVVGKDEFDESEHCLDGGGHRALGSHRNLLPLPEQAHFLMIVGFHSEKDEALVDRP